MAFLTQAQLEQDWRDNPAGRASRAPTARLDVVRLRGTVPVEHTLAKLGAEKLWRYLHTEDYVNALGALTGNQAMQQVKAGLKAIYLSGWQVAGRRQHCRGDVPGPVAVPGRLGAERGPSHQQRCSSAPTSCTTPRAAPTSTGCSRSWPTPRPASAAC
jgi:hypothetical protein